MRLDRPHNLILQKLLLNYESQLKYLRDLGAYMSGNHRRLSADEQDRFTSRFGGDNPDAMNADYASVEHRTFETELKLFLWFGFRPTGSPFDDNSRCRLYRPTVESFQPLAVPPSTLDGTVSPLMPLVMSELPVQIQRWLHEVRPDQYPRVS